MKPKFFFIYILINLNLLNKKVIRLYSKYEYYLNAIQPVTPMGYIKHCFSAMKLQPIMT